MTARTPPRKRAVLYVIRLVIIIEPTTNTTVCGVTTCLGIGIRDHSFEGFAVARILLTRVRRIRRCLCGRSFAQSLATS